MSRGLGDINFIDMLPSSISADTKVIAAAMALDTELKSVGQAITKIYLYSEIDNLPESILKHLAWQWHVDFWDDTLPLEEKRILVKRAYAWHRQKGTPAAVEEVVRGILGGGYVLENWEYGGEPYHFKVISNSPAGDAARYDQLLTAINATKNTRSWLDVIEMQPVIDKNIFFGGTVVVGATSTITDDGVWHG